MPYSIHIDFPVFLSGLFRRVYGILRQKLAFIQWSLYCCELGQMSAVFPFAQTAHKEHIRKSVPEYCVAMTDNPAAFV